MISETTLRALTPNPLPSPDANRSARPYSVHVPFNDASGDRLREWLGISREVLYDAKQVAILPMGFCFPGTGKSGDLPARPECATAWRAELLSRLKSLKLTLVIGQYAQAYHLPNEAASVTEAVQAWRKNWPHTVPLPHPSPRPGRCRRVHHSLRRR